MKEFKEELIQECQLLIATKTNRIKLIDEVLGKIGVKYCRNIH